MDTGELPEAYTDWWVIEFATDFGAAEFALRAIAHLQQGGKIGAIDIGVNKEELPSVYADRIRSLLELFMVGSRNPLHLGSISTLAAAQIEFNRSYNEELRRVDDAYSSADIPI